MRLIMVMYDTLNRRTLPNYGCTEVALPNFERLGREAVTFDTCYVGSLPCMPARRDLQTGRLSFLHRGWGPIEPFDDSVPEILKENGIYTHLVSDHDHYWEDGGATYHTRYSSWEIDRGQENDTWKGDLGDYEDTHSFGMQGEYAKIMGRARRQNAVNREYIRRQGFTPQTAVFDKGLEFIENNHSYDNWFLQIETFDPHEPFDAPEQYQKELGVDGFPYDWPAYGPVRENEAFIGEIRKKYLALLKSCDRSLGRVLDAMDQYDMWKDTMLIVNTDHGFLLGEHQWWAKNVMPMYNEISNIPLFIWDPRTAKKNERRMSLVQTHDLAPTILNFFGQEIPKDMTGKDLAPVIEKDQKVRDYALFGMFGGQVNITDGNYVYMRAPISEDNQPCYEYTLMPTDMNCRKNAAQLTSSSLREPFPFTKGMNVLKLPYTAGLWNAHRFGNLLYDLTADPLQLQPLEEPEKESEMIAALVKELEKCDAPKEQYERLGIQGI